MRTPLALAALALVLAAGCSDEPASTSGARQPSPATPTASPTPTSEPAWAIKHCRDEVLKDLKAPATAQWPGGEDVRPKPDSTPLVYDIYGQVDSQNGFGALIRSSWSCRVTTGAETWTIEVNGITGG